MTARHCVLICACLLQVRCQPETSRKPEGLLDGKTMARILTEVHLNEARVSKLGLSSSDSIALIYNRLHFNMLKKIGADTAVYNHSYTYYSARPALLTNIYLEVVDSLRARERAKAVQVATRPKA